MAFVDPDQIKEVIAPMMMVKGTTLAGISSPGDRTNHFSQLMEARGKDGELVFKTIVYETACDMCKKSGTAGTCKHNVNELPHWQSSSQKEYAAALMLDDKEKMESELHGIVTDAMARVFTHEQVKQIENAPHVNLPNDLDAVFIAIDPNGGGNSMFAQAAVVASERNIVIVGLDSQPTREATVNDSLACMFITNVATLPQLTRCRIVLLIECNLGYESQRIRSYLVDRLPETVLDRIVFMTEGKALAVQNGNVGLRTTQLTKEAMILNLIDYARRDKIKFSSTITTTDPKLVKSSRMKSMLLGQMGNYCMEISKTGKCIYTGKVDGQQDDLWIAMQLAAYARRVFFEHPKYQHLSSRLKI